MRAGRANHPDPRTLRRAAAALALAVSLAACGEIEQNEAEGPPDGIDSIQSALSTIDCKESNATGYVSGKPFTITLVTVDGKPVQKNTANAYYVMAKAATAKGVNLKVVSGFRTMAQQTTLYNCYKTCSCNNCNLAAKPGYSNHQSGHALDLNTSASGVYSWLTAHGAAYGFKKTVPSESWHWEWWSGGPGGGPCVTETTGTLKGVVYKSPTLSSPLGGATVKLSNGKTATTSSTGAFSFTAAPATYTITASKSGYVTASAKGTIAVGKSTTVNIGLEAVVTRDGGARDAGPPADAGAADSAQPEADDGGEPLQPEGDGGEPEGPPDGLDSKAPAADGCSVAGLGARGAPSPSSLAALLALALVLGAARRRARRRPRRAPR